MDLARSLAILDVGHGNCAVLCDRAGVVVIDTGPGSTLLEYLDRQQISRVELVLISHADKDHIAGLVALLGAKTVTIGRICLNSDALKGSDLWDDLLYELEQEHNADRLVFDVSLVRDDSTQYDHGDVHVEVLAPGRYLAARGPGSTDRQGRPLTTNTISAVIRLSRDDAPLAVFPGDIDEVGLDNLMENVPDARAPILVFPHHGGRGSADQAAYAEKVCRAFAPTTVVFSVARGRPKHPSPEVIALVRRKIASVRIACTQLTEHCASRTPPHDPAHLNPVFSEGREARKCCAGTLLIPLETSQGLLPSVDAHRKFIKAEAPTALCGG